jgi:ATP-dependent DNA helicase RecQ
MNSLSPKTLLQRYFGYPAFRPHQADIIDSILRGQDVLAVIATGGGKSICYQIPALVKEGLCVVISPLISLMKDQVDGLCENGISAAYLNSTLSSDRRRRIEKAILNGEVKILYLSPERLFSPGFIDFLHSVPINLFAIDEAHCISQWGHEFRPEYRKLSVIRRFFPHIPIIALTATATPSVRSDIITELKLHDPRIYIGSFNRQNLTYEICEKKNPDRQVMDFVSQHKNEPGIIYCFSKKQVNTLTALLQKNGIEARAYHADLPPSVRNSTQEQFLRDDIRVIVATIAFGMGIDKPDVRYVIHYDLPKSIENYYQETGRAGRDGDPAICMLLYARSDFKKIEGLFRKLPDGVERQIGFKRLNDMLGYCETRSCRRTVLLTYFGENFNEVSCDSCDNCKQGIKTTDGYEILSHLAACITALKQPCGVSYLADMMSGIATEKIKMRGDDALPLFGVGKFAKKPEWIFWIKELIYCGYLTSNNAQYPVVLCNAKTQAALKKEICVRLAEPEFQSSLVTTEAAEREDELLSEYDEVLYRRLCGIRKDIADCDEVPPYQIFSNRTLKEIARKRPRNTHDLITIWGIGEHKLKMYGAVVLDAVAAFQANEPLK